MTLACDHQRDAGLIYQDRVGLVHDYETGRRLDQTIRVERHTVGEEIEARAASGQIGDIRTVRGAFLLWRGGLVNARHRTADHPVHVAHPLGITAGKIVICREDVDAASIE